MSNCNTEVVQAIYKAFGDRDVEAVKTMVGPEFSITQTEQLPWGGSYQGTEGLQQFFAKLFGNVDSRVEFDEFFEAGDRVIAIGHTRGRVRSNNAPFDVRIVHLWTVEDGIAIRFEPFIDTPKMLEAIAAQPS